MSVLFIIFNTETHSLSLSHTHSSHDFILKNVVLKIVKLGLIRTAQSHFFPFFDINYLVNTDLIMH